MKTFAGTSYFSAILIAFLWIIPVTSAYAKSCKPSAELIDSYMELRKISSGLRNRPDLVSSDVIKAGSIEEIQYNSDGVSIERYYEDLKYHISNRAIQVDPVVIAGSNETIAWNKLRIETKLCLENRAPDPSLYPSGNIPQNNSIQAQPNNDAPPTKKLTAAERKKQQAQQKAEEISTKSQQLAQETQSKADAARQGKRKKHDPAAEAHHCIRVNTGGLHGSMVNTCNYKISYADCRYRNTNDELKDWLSCEKQKFGFGFIDAHEEDTTFTRKVQKIYWFACKEPARPVDYSFIEGSGIQGRCHDTANSD